MRRNHLGMLSIGLTILPVFLAGCKKGEFETATVRGTVYCHGEPMEGGQIIFYPQPKDGVSQITGKGAHGEIQSDGTFELSTYGTKDGAVIGRCHVKVYEPRPYGEDLIVEGDEDVEEQPLELACEMSETEPYVVEVKPGENNIKIELPMEK